MRGRNSSLCQSVDLLSKLRGGNHTFTIQEFSYCLGSMLALKTQFCIVTSNDDQEFCLHRFATFQKLRNNHSDKDCVAVFAAAYVVYPAHFFIKLFCYSRGNFNTILGNVPHQVDNLLLVRRKVMTLQGTSMYLAPVCCRSSCRLCGCS